MGEIRFNAMRLLCHVCLLVMLCGSTAVADDPNEDGLPDESKSASELIERTFHLEIYYLRGQADWSRTPREKRDLAWKIVERWDDGVVEPEPILVDAWLTKGKRDEFTGRMVYD